MTPEAFVQKWGPQLKDDAAEERRFLLDDAEQVATHARASAYDVAIRALKAMASVKDALALVEHYLRGLEQQ